MLRRLLLIACVLAAALAIAAAPPKAPQPPKDLSGLPITYLSFPDCTATFCILPRQATEQLFRDLERMETENERLRVRVRELEAGGRRQRHEDGERG